MLIRSFNVSFSILNLTLLVEEKEVRNDEEDEDIELPSPEVYTFYGDYREIETDIESNEADLEFLTQSEQEEATLEIEQIKPEIKNILENIEELEENIKLLEEKKESYQKRIKELNPKTKNNHENENEK